MDWTTFERIIAGVKQIAHPPLLFFGGFGEPLSHPDIVEMIRLAKSTGAVVELITNGMLLTQPMAEQFIRAGVNTIWFSIDGATPASYTDVRLGAALPLVLENIRALRMLCAEFYSPLEIGITFVAMKRNIEDLPQVITIGRRLGATQFSISNVLPHTSEMRDEILYDCTLYSHTSLSMYPEVSLPLIDINAFTERAVLEVLRKEQHIVVGGVDMSQAVNTCPFVEKGSISIRWDGSVSPCLPLLHTFRSYLDDRERIAHSFSLGSILEKDLIDLWDSQTNQSLRARLQAFDFSPCTLCNSCEMADSNIEDCFGNDLPTCGGCLWAQGLVQCP